MFRSAVLVLTLLVPVAASAEDIVHMKAMVFGCQSKAAARDINDESSPRHNDPRWISYVYAEGRCVRLSTQSPWAVIGQDENGVTRISYRGTIGKPATLYVPTAIIDYPAPPPPGDQAPAPPSDPAGGPALPQTSPEGTTPTPPGISQEPQPTAPPALFPPAPPLPPPPTHQMILRNTQSDGAGSPSAPSAPTSESAPPAESTAPVPTAPAPPESAAASSSGTNWFVWIVLLGMLLPLLNFIRKRFAENRRANMYRARVGQAENIVAAEIDAQRSKLRIRKHQLVFEDIYGTKHEGQWTKEKEIFFRTRLWPLLVDAGLEDIAPTIQPGAMVQIEDAANSEAGDIVAPTFHSSPEAYDPRMLPTDYEIFCARQLILSGWDARTTVATGDQGADVIATRDGKKLVVQCKLYASSIGNDAVQQVYSAKKYQEADFAAVVSNQPYTRSARQLADSNGVKLLHHDQLQGTTFL